MFESVVSSVLNKVLGTYVEGIDANALKLSVFGGKVELKDLHLKTSAFAGLGLSVSLAGGYVGSVVAEIPWRDLQHKPIVIRVSDIYASLRPRNEGADENELGARRDRLAADAAAWAAAAEEDASAPATEQSAFVQKLVDNVQVTVENLHIRFEDETSCQANAVAAALGNAEIDEALSFAAGLTLDRLCVESALVGADGKWETKFVETPHRFLNKIIRMGALDARTGVPLHNSGFAIYWLSGGEEGSRPIDTGDRAAWLASMRSYIRGAPSGTLACADAYAIGPVFASVNLTKDKQLEYDLQQPQNVAALSVSGIPVKVKRSMLQEAARVGEWATHGRRWQRFRQFRPEATVAQSPRQWWLFAKACIDDDRTRAGQTSESWSWPAIQENVEIRREYCGPAGLYTRKEGSSGANAVTSLVCLTKAEELRLSDVEMRSELDILCIKTFRDLARLEIARKLEQQQIAEANASKKNWFGSKKSSSPKMTESQRIYLEEPEEFSAAEAAGQAPAAWVKTQLNFELAEGKVELCNGSDNVFRAEYANVKAGVTMRDGSVSLSSQLGTFRIVDSGAEDTVFPCIVDKSTENYKVRLRKCVLVLAHPNTTALALSGERPASGAGVSQEPDR